MHRQDEDVRMQKRANMQVRHMSSGWPCFFPAQKMASRHPQLAGGRVFQNLVGPMFPSICLCGLQSCDSYSSCMTLGLFIFGSDTWHVES